MIIKKRVRANVIIFDISGNFLRTERNLGMLRQEVTKLLREGKRNFLINIGSIKKMDSSGLGEIVKSLAIVQKYNGRLGYFPSKDVIDKFGMELTQSTKKWGFSNESEAMTKLFLEKSFQKVINGLVRYWLNMP